MDELIKLTADDSKSWLWCYLDKFVWFVEKSYPAFYILLAMLVVIFVGSVIIWRRRRSEEEPPPPTIVPEVIENITKSSVTADSDTMETSGSGRKGSLYRIRKRDKVVFNAKRMLRKGSSFRPSLSRLASFEYLFSKKDKKKEGQAIRGPPSAFFEPDTAADENITVSPEVSNMFKNMRVFGHLESPCLFELCRHVTEITVPLGQYLFRPGDADDSIYIVTRGEITVYIRDNDQEYEAKKVGKGDSVYSLLSILDVLTGHSAPFKTVAAKATKDPCTVLKLSGSAFNDIFERYQESWIRTIQMIALRLQRVTFTTLHYYLGLTTELTKPTLRQPGMKSQFSVKKPRQPAVQPTLAVENVRPLRAAKPSPPGDPKPPVDPMPTLPFQPNYQPPMRTSHSVPKIPVTRSQSVDDAVHKKSAIEHLTQLLGLEDKPSLLDGRFEVFVHPPGHTLTEQGSPETGLIYVLDGTLELIQKGFDDGKPGIIALVHMHEMVGGLAILTGEPSFYSIKTRVQSHVVVIPKKCFYDLMAERPRIILNVAHTVVMRLSPFIRSIDFSLDWQMYDAPGRALYNQNDAADSLYVVLCGRLRAVTKQSEKTKQVVAEYGRGDLVGLVEVLTNRPRANTTIIVRYTELAKLPIGLLNFIKMKYPQVLTRIIHLLGHCILGQQEIMLAPLPYATPPSNVESVPHVANLNTIAIAAVSDDVPLIPFTYELWHAMKEMKSTQLLSSYTIERDYGVTAMQQANDYRLFSLLSQQEDQYSVVLYQCDPPTESGGLTPWTSRCILQADCVLVLANGDTKPKDVAVEELFTRFGPRTQKNLILLWPDYTESPSNTQEWLAADWVSSHYHIRVPHRVYIHHARQQSARNPKNIADYYDRRMRDFAVDIQSDFSRLARTLTGRAIGLVLGGGGARGAAHFGILRVLRENNIPIDFVGGTSIGALVGGIYCMDPDVFRATQKAREWFIGMTSYWKYIFEITYSYAARFSGWGFNRSLQSLFKDRCIEDLWIPYFNVTTDISASQMRVHRNGTLWRYVRASMTIAGILPPLCDPTDGHYLLDGCYVDNVPADVMRSHGCGEILAVDVGSQDETDLTNYGDTFNGFYFLVNKWNPWGQPMKVMNQTEIQSRLAYVSCVRQLEVVKQSPYCHYLRPKIDKYGTLDFGLFDEVCNVGFQHGQEKIKEWTQNGKLREIIKGKEPLCKDDRLNRSSVCQFYHSPQTFTDLAAYVSKIDTRSQFNFESEEDDDNEEFEVQPVLRDVDVSGGGGSVDSSNKLNSGGTSDGSGMVGSGIPSTNNQISGQNKKENESQSKK